ncbi:MAG TPA: antibiotic biosynthesis monooxygenase [Streptosporangiaceae bacterium]|nr:antibiotic biosynthesis monooxygenase [Streptosporangiaceae bacterium]
MSISVLVAFAGVLVAAVGTGLLGGQCIRSPRISYIAWSVGVFALTVALLAQSIGFATGFAAWSFRVVQLTAQLVAPLMLAWGLVELVAANTAVRFAARLVTAALVVVDGVVLTTDPLAAKPFSKSWPSASVHYQVIPHYALILTHLVVALAALAVLAVCVTRERAGAAVAWPPAVTALAGAALLLVMMRLSLPSPAYPALSLIAAGLVWFGTSRIGDVRAAPAREAVDLAAVAERARRRQGPIPPDKLVARGPATNDFGAADFPPGRRVAGRSRGDDRDRPPGGRDLGARDGFARDDLAEGGLARDGLAGDRGDREPADRGRGDRDRRGRDRPDPDGPSRRRYEPGAPGAEPATGMIDTSALGLPDLPLPAPTATGSRPGTDLALPVTPPHGLIAIYTLLEDKVADFDRAADEVAEQVRANEPDTLVYVIHTVPKAPMQRIFYEVYRDRAAFEQHEKQAYVQRFVTARRPYVLATNVIELRLKYAKVSPLPQAEAQAAQARAQAPGGNGQPPRGNGQPPGGSSSNLPAVRTGTDRSGTARTGTGRSGADGGRSGAGRDRPGTGGRQDPDRQPTYTPREPGYAPRDPGYAPREPGFAPRDPGFAPRPPREPGYRGTPRNRDPHRSQAAGEPPAAPRFGRI